jgi:uncharacterized protein
VAALLGAFVFANGMPLAMAQGTRSAAAPPAPVRAAKVKTTYPSPEAAYDYGISALRSGHPDMAIEAFEFAAENDIFLAEFYLARIYADNSVPYTNHGRAFEIYQRIVTEHAGVDVDDDPKAPFVAKAMTALAAYFRTGIANAGVAQNLEQGATLLRDAAKSFRDEDAQFEFAKILLKGEGIAANPREALYWLRELSTRGHASAQAFLADLYWRGTQVPRDPVQAYLLIDVAVQNAPAADRVWIEDIYQYIFCGASEGVRRQAQGAVADWRSKYGRQREERLGRDGLATIQPRAVRTCSNGEPAQPGRRSEQSAEPAKPRGTGFVTAPMPGTTVGNGSGFVQGATPGFGLQDAGQMTLTQPK